VPFGISADMTDVESWKCPEEKEERLALAKEIRFIPNTASYAYT